MGVRDFSRKAWDLFTLTTTGPTYRFDSQQYTPLDDLWREMFLGGAKGPVTREQLLSVPAGLKARDTVCGISTWPLRQYDEQNRVVSSALFAQFDAQVPNVVHLAQTLEDLFADGISWWEIVERTDGRPSKVRRRSDNNVSLNPPASTTRGRDPLPGGYDPREAVVYVDGRQVAARNMIRFDSPKQAARKVMWRTLQRAIALEDQSRMFATDPRPADYFTPKQGMPDPATDGEIATLLRKWRNNRREHSTGYVPAALEYNSVDVPTPVELQLVQLLDRAALDLAVAFGLDPSDVGAPVQSMTYANVVDKRQDRINDLLSYFMLAVCDRLKMDDVTPAGHEVRFDASAFLRADPFTRAQVQQIYAGIGVMGPAYVAQIEQLPPEAVESAPAPEPAPDNVTPIRGRAALAADAPGFTFDGGQIAVDLTRRTISGVAVPFGRHAVATKYGRKFRFQPGGLTWDPDMSRVKMLEDHNPALAFGHMAVMQQDPDGLRIVAKVGRGVHGDRMLALAQDRVKDGLSIGVDWLPEDEVPDPYDPSVTLVLRGVVSEISQTAMPAFTDSRVTGVAASRDQEGTAMPCQLCGHIHADGVACPTPTGTTLTATVPPAVVPEAVQGATFTAAQVTAMLAMFNSQAPVGIAAPAAATPVPVINPEGAGDDQRVVTTVREALPYRFSVDAKTGELNFRSIAKGEHQFHADLLEMSRRRDDGWNGGTGASSDAGKRVLGMISGTFDTDTADVATLNPSIQRPDMFVDQKDYRLPIWQRIGRGGPPNGVQPFIFPKFSTSSGLVADHVQGVEPDAGVYTATNQTVTPSALSGKASLTREVWDMGGNPATASLIFNQMRRGYFEGLESAAATFLNTLTAAADIVLTAGAVDDVLAALWDAAVADLQFIRGYDLTEFVIEKNLYKAFVAATAGDDRKIFPIIGPVNTNGQARARFQSLDLAGIEGIPSWALPGTAGSVANSWLFDRTTIYGWATPPQRLEFPGTDASGDYAPVAMVDLAIWGYKGFANTDIGGVRQVTYDTTA